jgi:hypothetical protein
MVATREGIIIEDRFCILTGLVSHGIEIFGPFDTFQEALDYCDKKLTDTTWEIAIMRKEITDAND